VKKLVLIPLALTVIAVAAQAGEIVLTFAGLADDEGVANYYDGGTGSLGSGPGPNYGISFGSASLALTSGNFSNSPSGTILFFQSGSAIMNVAAGFDTGFSFYYAASQSGSVTVYDGLNGTGDVLTSLALPTTTTPYSVWDPIGVTFAGTAESVDFGGAADYIGFDNITLGASVPDGGSDSTPEPDTLALTGTVLLGAAGFRVVRNRKI
jgi:hypothetical protein